jgi:hypothetical protein
MRGEGERGVTSLVLGADLRDLCEVARVRLRVGGEHHQHARPHQAAHAQQLPPRTPHRGASGGIFCVWIAGMREMVAALHSLWDLCVEILMNFSLQPPYRNCEHA